MEPETRHTQIVEQRGFRCREATTGAQWYASTEGGLLPFNEGGRPLPRLGGRARAVSGRASLGGGPPAIAARQEEVAGPAVDQVSDSAGVGTTEAASSEI